MIDVGRVREIARYPVKSMAGIVVSSASLGWYGLAADRRFGFRRIGDTSGMPWLTASRLPELLLYRPEGLDERSGEPFPTHVRTPEDALVALESKELTDEISGRLGNPVELMRLRHGIFDEAAISVISLTTIAGIGREAGFELDRRRFRANIVVETPDGEPFLEDTWVGRTLVFGEGEQGPAVNVVQCDERCAMLNIDPDTAAKDARVMKAVVRLNKNYAGVYANVLQRGVIRAGDRVRLA